MYARCGTLNLKRIKRQMVVSGWRNQTNPSKNLKNVKKKKCTLGFSALSGALNDAENSLKVLQYLSDVEATHCWWFTTSFHRHFKSPLVSKAASIVFKLTNK